MSLNILIKGMPNTKNIFATKLLICLVSSSINIAAHSDQNNQVINGKKFQSMKIIRGRENPKLIPEIYSYHSFFQIVADKDEIEARQIIHFNIPSITEEEMSRLRELSITYLKENQRIRKQEMVCNKVRLANENNVMLTNNEIAKLESNNKRLLQEHFLQEKSKFIKNFRAIVVNDIKNFIAKEIIPGSAFSDLSYSSFTDDSPNSSHKLYSHQLCSKTK